MGKKIFTEKQINTSAFLAGPIPPGVLICKNYIALGKARSAYLTIIFTFLFTVIFFYGLLQVPEVIMDKIPNLVFTAFYAVIVAIAFRFLMHKDVSQALENGASKGSNWDVAGTTVLGFILNLGIIFTLAMEQPYYECEYREVDGNELYYESDQVPINSVDLLSEQLIQLSFFEPNSGNIAKLEMIGDAYQITLLVDEEYWSNNDLVNELIGFKLFMQVEFGRETFLQLEAATLSGKVNRKHL